MSCEPQTLIVAIVSGLLNAALASVMTYRACSKGAKEFLRRMMNEQYKADVARRINEVIGE